MPPNFFWGMVGHRGIFRSKTWIHTFIINTMTFLFFRYALHKKPTNTVIMKKKYPLKCVCVYRKNKTNGKCLSHFLQVSNFVLHWSINGGGYMELWYVIFRRKLISTRSFFDILWNTYSLDVICILPHEVVIYDIKFFATSYFFHK